MVGRFSQQAPSFSLLAQGRKSFHWLCCLPGWAFGHLSFRFFHSHYLHFQIYLSTWQYKPILSNGALRAFTFPCSRWKVPAKHQGLGAIWVLSVDSNSQVSSGLKGLHWLSVSPAGNESGEDRSVVSAQHSSRQPNTGGSSACNLYVTSGHLHHVCPLSIIEETKMGLRSWWE